MEATPETPFISSRSQNNQCTRCGWVGTDAQKVHQPDTGSNNFSPIEGANALACPKCECIEFYTVPHINDERPLAHPTYWMKKLQAEPGDLNSEAAIAFKVVMAPNALYKIEDGLVYDFNAKENGTNFIFIHGRQLTDLPELLKIIPGMFGDLDNFNDTELEYIVQQEFLEISEEEYRGAIVHGYNLYVQLIIQKL